MRCGWLILSVVVALLALTGQWAPASPVPDPHHQAGDKTKTGPEGDGKSEDSDKAHPPGTGAHTPAAKDPFARALDLTLWTIVVFLLMLLVLWRFAWGPLLRALQGREKSIADAIALAQKDREEAGRLREQFQQELNRAAETVRGMMDEARRDAQHTKDELLAQARAEIEAEKQRLRREIEMARDQALQDIWNKTVELAATLSSTTIRRRLSTDDHRALVDEALGELGPAAADWRRRQGGQPV